MADKELLLQLKNCFDQCKPAFIALGDEVRLTIVTALAWTALTGHPPGISSEQAQDVSGLTAFPSHRAGDTAAPVKGMSVNEITNTTKLSRPAISHHLKILKSSRLVDSVQIGTSNIYYLTFGATTDLLHQLTSILYEIKGRNE